MRWRRRGGGDAVAASRRRVVTRRRRLGGDGASCEKFGVTLRGAAHARARSTVVDGRPWRWQVSSTTGHRLAHRLQTPVCKLPGDFGSKS